MDLLSLPDEMLSEIFQYLNLQSKLYLYDISSRFETVLRAKKLTSKSCQLTFVHMKFGALEHPYFNANKENITKLDVSGVNYVPVDQLIYAITQFTNLQDLNVGYTNIIMPDSHQICSNLPNLVTLCINLKWIRGDPTNELHSSFDLERIFGVLLASNVDLLAYRQTLRHLECVHFITCTDNLYFNTFFFLAEPNQPKELKLTVMNERYVSMCRFMNVNMGIYNGFPYKKVTIDMCVDDYKFEQTLDILDYTPIESWEWMLIKYSECNTRYVEKIYVTPNLLPTTPSVGGIQCSVSDDLEVERQGQYKLIMWHKDYHTGKIFEKVKDYLSYNMPVTVTSKNVNEVMSYKGNSDTFFVCNCALRGKNLNDIDKMIPTTSVVKNLSLGRACPCDARNPSGFCGNSLIFKNLKLLRLGGEKLCDEIYKELFIYCSSLETLIVQIESNLQCLHYLRYSKSLKNICVSFQRYDANEILLMLSTCPTLENIKLEQYSTYKITRWTLLHVLRKCPNIHYLELHPGSATDDKRWMTQTKTLHEVALLRPYFTYRLPNGGQYFHSHRCLAVKNPYHRLFLLHDSFKPEDVN